MLSCRRLKCRSNILVHIVAKWSINTFLIPYTGQVLKPSLSRIRFRNIVRSWRTTNLLATLGLVSVISSQVLEDFLSTWDWFLPTKYVLWAVSILSYPIWYRSNSPCTPLSKWGPQPYQRCWLKCGLYTLINLKNILGISGPLSERSAKFAVLLASIFSPINSICELWTSGRVRKPNPPNSLQRNTRSVLEDRPCYFIVFRIFRIALFISLSSVWDQARRPVV